MMNSTAKILLPPITGILQQAQQSPSPPAVMATSSPLPLPPLYRTMLTPAPPVPPSYFGLGNYRYDLYKNGPATTPLPPLFHTSTAAGSGPVTPPALVPHLQLPPVASLAKSTVPVLAPAPAPVPIPAPMEFRKSCEKIKRKTRNNLPKETTYILLKWLNDHLNHPYPNSFEKNQLMMLTGLNQQQLSNWFINARRRKIKSMKEQKRLNLI